MVKTETATRRMTLDAVTRGKQSRPHLILLYGTEGVGKSTWAADAPSPIFIPVEDGTAHLDVARMPRPRSWAEILEAIETLTTEEHEYQTVVIDTLDAAEALCWQHLCERDKKSSIEDYGYGKGYAAALDEWRVLLSAIERMQERRNMGVILIAHSWIKAFRNPESEDFDRHELKMHARAAGLLKDWANEVLFAHHEILASKGRGETKAKGVIGERIISTTRSAAWDAKNRHSLPERLPLAYEDFAAACAAGSPRPVEELRASIAAKLAELDDGKLSKTVQQKMAAAGQDGAALAKIESRLTALLAERHKGE